MTDRRDRSSSSAESLLPRRPIDEPFSISTAPEAPAQKPEKEKKPRQLPKKMRDGIDMMQRKGMTLQAAAEAIGVSRQYFSKQFHSRAGLEYRTHRMQQNQAVAALRSSVRAIELVDSESEKVAADKWNMGVAGIRPVREGTNINVNVGLRAGYVIDLREDASKPLPPRDLPADAGGRSRAGKDRRAGGRGTVMADISDCITKLVAAGQITRAIGDEALEMFKRSKAEYPARLGPAGSDAAAAL
jgi:hypothetical protein